MIRYVIISLNTFVFLGLADVMYILPKNANLLETPAMGAPILLSIPHGEKVNAEDADGLWVNITYKNNRGWICKFNLSNTDPVKDSIIQSLNNTNLKKNARRRASDYSTAATTRGLSEMNEIIRSDADYNGLKEMMAYKPKKEDVYLFMQDGGLTLNETN